MQIRPLQKSDYPQWLPLWEDNCLHQVPINVTSKTWQWICKADEPVVGLGLFVEDSLVGMVHCILHKSTGDLSPAGLMQDLYVDPKYRGRGYAKVLVRALADLAADQKWCRLYWLADGKNKEAQALYKNIGVKLDFSLHAYPL